MTEAEDHPVARIAVPAVLRTGAPAAVLAALPGARAVGGAVRDTLAGLPVQDVDVAAPLPPEEIATRLRAAGLKVFETGLSHGTVTAVLDHQPVEVTALRRDVATDGRHAEVAWTTSWREDAARRDFTINAMSLDEHGDLFDYFGGREDLARGLVRFVGDPATRLREDSLRILRFFRFHTRYGRGEPDAAAVAAIRAAIPGLARLSVERVWMELKRILAAPDPTGAAALMQATGVLGAVVPHRTSLPDLRRLLELGGPAEPLLRLVALLPERPAPRALARRLKASTEEQALLDLLSQARHAEEPRPGALASPAGAARIALHLGRTRFGEARARHVAACLLTLQALARPQSEVAHWVAARAMSDKLPLPVFPLGGADAMALGIEAGPRMGMLLGGTREWWVDGGCVAGREACLAELGRRIAEPDKEVGGAGQGGV
ncbi:MAG TPA: CCA tRNA nucleotidyltransferase [Acetobacteraceae bacterium]|nr:CCA tRNA nucleotidyltransferase [Acetobacteraceae bacterium]